MAAAQPVTMLALLLALAANPQHCTDVPQQCRACTVVAGRQQCSTIGIACQPTKRICRPADQPEQKSAPAPRPKGS
ncbi:hypothetical protein ACBY01_03830 [Sphingomonas sp. ac-8]|uniref:hypothetical protein n=1 Tax=Sphingomonas sp. ac-8 TaxID=3242977 RepID=UPI003A808A36